MENISFMRNGKEFEPTKDELKRVLDDYAERLALTEKALELACSYLWEISGREDCPNAFSSEEFDEINKCNCVHDERNINGKCWIELFKYDAKKELEKSKGDEK
ncbi:MAG: hypothetical protein IJ371_02955 [Clostridia bacterium]|nr:hypothetical protein [Clostridia bacterium]